MPNQIHDLRKTKHFIVDHRIVDEYLPAIGGKAFMLYSIYCRIASSYKKVFPSIRSLKRYMGCGSDQIMKSNAILEDIGLIKIIRETTKSGDKDNNKYILLEPKTLSDDIKNKYYPKNWEPLLKFDYGGVPDLGTPSGSSGGEGVPESGTPVYPGQEHRDPVNGTPVYPKQVHINNNTVVVKNTNTTTMNAREMVNTLRDYVKLNTSLSVVAFSGLEKILNTSIKKMGDSVGAFNYVISKIDQFKDEIHKKNNPLGFLHNAVKDDFTNHKVEIVKEQKRALERVNNEENIYKEKLLAAWMNLDNLERANYFKEALKYRFIKSNKRNPNQKELDDLLNELSSKCEYEGISIRFPAPQFKL